MGQDVKSGGNVPESSQNYVAGFQAVDKPVSPHQAGAGQLEGDTPGVRRALLGSCQVCDHGEYCGLEKGCSAARGHNENPGGLQHECLLRV